MNIENGYHEYRMNGYHDIYFCTSSAKSYAVQSLNATNLLWVAL